MASAVIVDAVRTPLGMRGGALAGWHPVDLAAHVLRALVERVDLDPALVEDVVMGCVSQVGDQAANIGRSAPLAAGFPDSVVGTTIDRQCGSSQQALHFAAQGVLAGAYDVVIAAGVESLSRVPVGSTFASGGRPFGPQVRARYELVPQGIAAERIAQKWSITRDECDALALESHQRAGRATDRGDFDREIVPVPVDPGERGTALVRDEAVRGDLTIEELSTLKPTFDHDGVVTAGNSAAIADGAAALLVMSEARACALGLTARARFCAFALAGSDPVLMHTALIPATARVLERARLRLDDVDVIEVNESFAPVVLAWAREHRPDPARVNPSGGAIALGHPLGCSGARLMTTLVGELQRSEGRYGLQLMAEAGGMANATLVERLG